MKYVDLGYGEGMQYANVATTCVPAGAAYIEFYKASLAKMKKAGA